MTTVQELRSPEKVLSIIAATARLSGIAAPRRITFDEPGPGQRLAVLAMSWPSMADMRPWLSVFRIDPHRPDATTVYGDYHGWSLMLNAPDASTACRDCGGDVVHRAGCPSEPEHLADHYAAEAAGVCMYCPTVVVLTAEGRIAEHTDAYTSITPCAGSGEWPATDWDDEAIPKGSVVELADFLAARRPSRVNPEAAEKLPVLVLDVTRDATETLSVGSPCGRCSQPIGPDDLIEAHPTADWFVHVECAPVAYTPVHYPTGVEVNRAECARLDAETQDAVLTAEQRHCHTIDVVTVDPELVDDGRGDPGMAHLMAVPAVHVAPDEPAIELPLPPQTSFAEAAERLETVRDAEVAEYAHAMLAEASE